MRALRYNGQGLSIEPRAEDPAPAEGEAVVRVRRAGVSDEDIELVRRAPGPRGAIIPGQEFVGAVESLYAGAPRDERRRWEGKRIVASPVIACGRCDLCRAGVSAHCRDRRVVGRPGGADGCFAERIRLPVRNLVAVPDEVDDDRAAFAVPLAGALHAAHVVRVEGKPYVTVLGDGVTALLAAQVLVRLNATVRVLGADPRRLALCEKWGGIKHRPLVEAGRRRDQAVVVECTGTPAGLTAALELVRPRGKVVLLRPVAGDLAPAVENEIELVGASSCPVADAVACLARAEVDVLSLIARRFRFADALDAFRAAADPAHSRILVEF